MTYEQTIKYLYDSAPVFQKIGSAAYKEGMENSFLIDKYLGEPHRHYATIHVAGTNGKGSVSHLLASVLQEAGYKTGLYTSPHLIDFRERIRVNGQMLEKEYVVGFIKQYKSFFESIKPSFFELTTGLAFSYFTDKEIDIAVIEVGLGGRLDCTNVISPILSIITNISFDHTALLGNTLTAIAHEKAGIIKAGIPVVIGEAESEERKVFENIFKSTNHQTDKPSLVFAEDEKPIISSSLLSSGHWLFETKHYPHLEDELGGFAQKKNAATALCAIEQLQISGLKIHSENIYAGFLKVRKNTELMGRWQIVGQQPKIILDTGHNVGGMAYNTKQLHVEKCKNLHIVFGMVNDKDISAVLALMPKEAKYYFAKASVPRALDSVILLEKAANYGLKGEAFPTVSDALSTAKNNTSKDDVIFVGGSTFVVADAIKKNCNFAR
ncbi:MAG: bifunctional folylpolyglutamate synthase/dihydrofolate synthase [Dysgonamonadaceae bacterium]|jgi:dihydrofolate synthase/folylpolyglutamate synthase|nr:bifunctional folylpolyglutamate synthase/dihydrofolate synthase [Dysgonamonadaceae bacterium]